LALSIHFSVMKMNPNASQPGFSSPVTSLWSLFPLGRVVIIAHCFETLVAHNLSFAEALVRHADGDWGDLVAQDKALNDQALAAGTGRLFSAYELTDDVEIWIITESDRSCTTVLLPEDY